MSLKKKVDKLNRETEVISKMLNEPKGILFIDRNNPNTEVDSRIALDALFRVGS